MTRAGHTRILVTHTSQVGLGVPLSTCRHDRRPLAVMFLTEKPEEASTFVVYRREMLVDR